MAVSRRARRALAMAAALTLLTAALVAAPASGGPGGGAAESGDDAHGGHAEWNLHHGFIGEKDGVEPGLLWRKPGTPPPFFGLLLNYGLLFYILVRFARKPVTEALKKRKSTIMGGMQEASTMKDDAAKRLADYEDKLAHVDEEIERVRREMRETGQRERERILAEAKERQVRMERDARLLIEQELKAAHERLLKETIRTAVKSAEEKVTKQAVASDHRRLADNYLAGLGTALEQTGVGRA